MNRYIALLRGINVSGHNAIRMAALQTSFITLGLQEPQTYLQSGNVVFRSASTVTAALAQTIAAQITRDFGHAVPVLLHCPEGYGKTKVSNSTFEKLLGVPATTRNWRTVLALRAMCQP